MEPNEIKTLEMIRKIRDENAQRLAGKSHARRIAFYRKQAKKLEMKMPALRKEIQPESDHSVILQADNDSAWEKPILVRKTR